MYIFYDAWLKKFDEFTMHSVHLICTRFSDIFWPNSGQNLTGSKFNFFGPIDWKLDVFVRISLEHCIRRILSQFFDVFNHDDKSSLTERYPISGYLPCSAAPCVIKMFHIHNVVRQV